MLPTIAFAIPIRPGQLAAWKRFADEVSGRYRDDWREHLRRAGIRSERVWHQPYPGGDLAVIVWDCEEPMHAVQRFREPANDFVAERLRHVLADVHGIDPSVRVSIPTLISQTDA